MLPLANGQWRARRIFFWGGEGKICSSKYVLYLVTGVLCSIPGGRCPGGGEEGQDCRQRGEIRQDIHREEGEGSHQEDGGDGQGDGSGTRCCRKLLAHFPFFMYMRR